MAEYEGKGRMTVQSYQPQVNLTAYETAAKQKRVIRGLVTLAVLAGLVLLGLKYHDSLLSIVPGASNKAQVSTADASVEQLTHVSPVARSKRITSAHHANTVGSSSESEEAGFAESASRPPLLVEVIYGTGQRQIIRTRDDSIYLDLRDKTMSGFQSADVNTGYGSGVVNASAQSPLTSTTLEPASVGPASATSQVAKQQTIEGAVVFLARIDKDGDIDNLQVLSGPESLYGAAREAVKHWHFKPYYKSGQAVPTDAQITVKFAIAAR